jgi:predicted homoserine dehydrogenase-like protein
MRIRDELARRAAAGMPIRVGVAGSGAYGRWVITQCARIPGLAVAVVADPETQRALAVYEAAGWSREDVIVAASAPAASDAIARGQPVVVPEGDLLAECPVDVVMDATGVVESGASTGYRSLLAGKHFVTVNAAADCVFGPILRRTADAARLAYALAAGDQPALIGELCEFARTLHLEVISAGKGSVVRAVEEVQRQTERAGRQISRAEVAFYDGSQNQEEMATTANATGLVPDVRGMHQPAVPLAEVAGTLVPREHGGILSRSGVIDLVNCVSPEDGSVRDPMLASGVFVVVTSDNPIALECFRGKGVPLSHDGRHALLLRPFHLVGIETPRTIAEVAITGEPPAAPLPTPVADVVAIAKRNLRAGERLDGMGGEMVRGEIERADLAQQERMVPYGLATGVRLGRDVPSGAVLTYDALDAPGDTFGWTLRRLQDLAVWS